MAAHCKCAAATSKWHSEVLMFWSITAGSFASAAAGGWLGSTVAESPHRALACGPREAAAQPGSVLPNGFAIIQ